MEYIIKDRLFEAKFPLGGKKTGDAYQLSNWDDNQYVTYTIDLSPNLISFNAIAVPWAPYDGDKDKNVGDAENKDGVDVDDDGTDDDIHLQN